LKKELSCYCKSSPTIVGPIVAKAQQQKLFEKTSARVSSVAKRLLGRLAT
jgi:hypothetical protein